MALSLAAGDLDGNGTLDLAVANGWTNNVSIMFNTVVDGAHRVGVNGVDEYPDRNFGIQLLNDPLAATDDKYRVLANSTANVLQVLENDRVEAGRVLSVVELGPTSGGGQVEIGPDGKTVLYWPAADSTGTETFTYTISDGDRSVGAIVKVNVANIAARVVGLHVFYNNSAFDGNDPQPNAADDAVIATDKTVLLPGGKATFASYTSYSRGINGIMVDIADFPDKFTPEADDFLFRTGNSNDPTAWAEAPKPTTITVRPGEGTDGSGRLTVIWPDYAIRNQWLQVTVPANKLGLAEDDVFYFGNAVAEAGNSDADAGVTTTDLLLARNNPRNSLRPAGIGFPYDYNRDGRVNTTDVLLARNHQTNFLSALKLIDLTTSEVGGQDEALPILTSPEQDPSPPATGWDAWFDDLTWLYEFEQMNTQSLPSHKRTQETKAVDKLLATYWP